MRYESIHYTNVFRRRLSNKDKNEWIELLVEDYAEAEYRIGELESEKEDRDFLEPKNLYDAEKWDIATMLYLLELKDLQAIFEQYKEKIK